MGGIGLYCGFVRTRTGENDMSEHAHQAALIQWAALAERTWPELRLLYAIPNGGQRSKATAGKLKAEGVRAGIPDLCLPVPRGGFGACYIELKAPATADAQPGKLTKTQRDMLLALKEAGNSAHCCVGWEDARDVLQAYLAGQRKLPT